MIWHSTSCAIVFHYVLHCSSNERKKLFFWLLMAAHATKAGAARAASMKFGTSPRSCPNFNGISMDICGQNYDVRCFSFSEPSNSSVPPVPGSVSAMSVRFHYGSVPRRFGSTTFRFGFCIAGSVPLRFGSVTVRFHRFPVRFRQCRFGSITVRFRHGSVPPLSGSVSALPVRFHYGSVPSRFGSTAFRSVSAVPVRFHYGSVLVGPVRRFPVRFRGHYVYIYIYIHMYIYIYHIVYIIYIIYI